MSEKKCIKYFAAHYCPHSNEHSRAYHLINTLFKNYYPDVTVEVFWGEDVSEDNKHEFLNANAQYVPTITNSKYANIDLSLPKDYNTEGKTDTELTYAILENIYNQLDKEKDESINTQKEELINTKKENCGVDHIENYDINNKNSKSFIEKTLDSLNNNKFVGCRIPNHPIALELLKSVSFPIAAPSANIATKLSSTRTDNLDKKLKNKVFYIDGGASKLGLESTVVDLTTKNPKILRYGSITKEQLKKIIPNIAYTKSKKSTRKSPGMSSKHYSPNTPIRINVKMNTNIMS